MSPLGIVVYKPGREPGTLEADWYYSKLGQPVVCKGTAKGGVPGRMESDYTVFYYGPDGEDAGQYELSLQKQGEIFIGRWMENGDVVFHGVGIAMDGGIGMAWQSIGI